MLQLGERVNIQLSRGVMRGEIIEILPKRVKVALKAPDLVGYSTLKEITVKQQQIIQLPDLLDVFNQKMREA